ncbi:MAG: hypothetical protein PHI23_05070 [Candidatus Peribacteraceae bacterium]|nr:hypothetical protein [Candidatus Peribacteraceae bacterium]
MPETLSPSEKFELVRHGREELQLTETILKRALGKLAARHARKKPEAPPAATAANEEAGAEAAALEVLGEPETDGDVSNRLKRLQHDLHLTMDGVIAVPFSRVRVNADPAAKTLPREEDIAESMAVLRPLYEASAGTQAETLLDNIAHLHAGYVRAVRNRLDRLDAIEQELTEETTGAKQEKEPAAKSAEPARASTTRTDTPAPKSATSKPAAHPDGDRQPQRAPVTGKVPAKAPTKKAAPVKKQPAPAGTAETAVGDSGVIPFEPVDDAVGEEAGEPDQPAGAVTLEQMRLTDADMIAKPRGKGH